MTHLASYFRELPYKAQIFGQLKAEYRGELNHVGKLSSSLVERLAAEPERLRELIPLLSNTAPIFSAPIYIGVASAQGLRTRLSQHVRKINEFLEAEARGEAMELIEADEQGSFAYEVIRRKMDPNNLVVFASTLHHVGSIGLEKDLENLLNRLYYPVCGRN